MDYIESSTRPTFINSVSKTDRVPFLEKLEFSYLRQGGHVLLGFCLIVCLTASNFA